MKLPQKVTILSYFLRQCFYDRKHEAYRDSLVYYHEDDSIAKDAKAGMHGLGVASILTGKYGVARDASLYYVAADFDALKAAQKEFLC